MQVDALFSSAPILAGIPSILIGSAPGAALFFGTYETLKHVLGDGSGDEHTGVHMLAASVGEVVACTVRVPTEVLKQRAQASGRQPMVNIVQRIRVQDGWRGFYRGFGSTIIREIPFSIIELPLWETLKRRLALRLGRKLEPVDVSGVNTCAHLQSASCGAVAGTVAACVTTPLDVAKTRIMLNERVYGSLADRLTVRQVLADVWRVNGLRGVYAGVVPRSIWMGIGGFVFFGAFELSRRFFEPPKMEPIELTASADANSPFNRMAHRFERTGLRVEMAIAAMRNRQTIEEKTAGLSFDERIELRRRELRQSKKTQSTNDE